MIADKMPLKEMIVFLTIMLLVITFVVFAASAYPVPAGDSQFFLVPAVQLKSSGIMTSPLFPSEWEIDKIVDPTGARRFLFYPPLFPLILSFLMPVSTAEGVFVAIAIINIFVILFSALLFYKVATQNSALTWAKTLLIILALFALASSLAEVGRPEVLARLWVVLGALIILLFRKKYDWFVHGVLLGLIFATHPPAGFFSVVILGIVYGYKEKNTNLILKGLLVLSIAFFVSLAIIALGPFGVRETIEGVFANAVVVNHGARAEIGSRLTFGSIWNQLFASQATPFYGFVLMALGFSGISLYKRWRNYSASPWFFGFFIITLTFLTLKTLYSLGHIFYFSLFAPIIFAIFILFFDKTNLFGKFFIVAVLILVSVGILRTSLLFPYFLDQGASLESARKIFLEISSKNHREGKLIGITGGLWALSEDYEGIYSYNFWPQPPKPNTDLVFFQQRYSGRIDPPPVFGCSIIFDKFAKETPKIFNLTLGNTMPGYGYAVYGCGHE